MIEDVELDGVPFQNFLFEVRDLVKELTGKKRLTSGDVFWSAVDAWERNLTALDAAQAEVQIAKIILLKEKEMGYEQLH